MSWNGQKIKREETGERKDSVIPIPKTLVIWASSVTLSLTLTQIAKTIWEEDTHINRVLGKGMPISL